MIKSKTRRTNNEIKKDLPPIAFGDFFLVNNEKVDRVIKGVPGQTGELIGGLGENAPIEQILALYDKTGGLILDKENRKLAHGCFWDFQKKKPKDPPEIAYRDDIGPKTINIREEKVGDKPKRKAKIEEE